MRKGGSFTKAINNNDFKCDPCGTPDLATLILELNRHKTKNCPFS